MPQVTVPQVVQPQVGTLRPNDHSVYRPDYRPNYRSDYRPNYRTEYRPNYRPLYRSDYRPYYRPYYSFLPRVRLGFGLWIGYPVRYPTYFYPYAYPYSYSYPYAGTAPYPTYPAAASVGAAGGLSFEITPPEAGVYVDGLYIGTVGQFTPNQPPLSLAPGRHHVEIREPGFEIVAFDVDILPGQVIPYRGDLQPF
jgi:PEGA domain